MHSIGAPYPSRPATASNPSSGSYEQPRGQRGKPNAEAGRLREVRFELEGGDGDGNGGAGEEQEGKGESTRTNCFQLCTTASTKEGGEGKWRKLNKRPQNAYKRNSVLQTN